MQQIADWLEKLGLPEYAQRFAENTILGDLTDQDLEKIGIASLGGGRKNANYCCAAGQGQRAAKGR
jgi:hypothetical protein